jgi:hypothetical protein
MMEFNRLECRAMIRESCPNCGSEKYKKNGHIHNGKKLSLQRMWQTVCDGLRIQKYTRCSTFLAKI